MNRGKRTFMAGVHGLQHVEGFFAADLADHDAVGAHTQTVDDQLAHAHGTFAFDVGSSGFEADDVFLLELQFGGVFDGDDALDVGNVAGENIEQSSFSGASSSGDEEIQLSFDHRGEQFEHGFGEGVILQHIAGGDGIAAETADGEARSVKGERRNDGVDAGAIGEAGVDHGRRFIDTAADAGDDALDDLHEVRIVFERQAGQFKLSGALNVYPVEAVDQNIGDGVVFEQRFERTEAEDLIENFAGETFAFGEAERNGFVVDCIADENENFFAGGIAVRACRVFRDRGDRGFCGAGRILPAGTGCARRFVAGYPYGFRGPSLSG